MTELGLTSDMGSRHALRTSACALASRRSGGVAGAAEPLALGGAGLPASVMTAAGYGSDSEMGGASDQALTQRNRSLRHLRESRRRSSNFTLCAQRRG